MKKYLTKFAVDILPSVAATVIGAYIVNHYIVAKPSADTPAAVVSTAAPEAAKADAKADAKSSATTSAKASPKAPEASSDLANVRGPGVTAKGISEKAILEKTAAEKPAENIVEKPTETAAIPVEPRRHQPAPRERTVAKTAPAPAVAPVVSAPATPPPADAASAADERRDANDLARAAIDRLRGSNEASPRVQDAARAPEAVRTPDAPRVAPAVRPLPPPIMVSAPPPNETLDAQAASSPRPPYGAAGSDDPGRPTPPAEIPSRPLDLRAEATGPAVRERTTVAEDVLSAAKSVFHAVLPK
ncbi:hypothetical protein KMZ68_05155 [Bradyrhizobium sediminis]|uniref:Uncharacterized protein n=1 Tax=Bradyrhizobium sediminis TaxID=2840469 RepID=A0A975NU33_9BRAD|nr:hypothetical protein [Bradyrhizobium sediminis]QWG20741.1 hypothetical protein KMZ68_05155 [Bradyrhizobium sediminis]